MKSVLKKLSSVRELSAVLFLVGMYLLVGLINPAFLLDMENLRLCINGSVIYILLAMGVSFVIMTSDIDVSIGAILGITAAFAGTMIRGGMSYFLVIPLTTLLGAGIGLINGLGVAKLKIPAIIMTLGTNGIIRGYIYIYTGGKWVENLPENFKKFSQATIFGTINILLLFSLALVAVVLFIMKTAKFGKYFHAVGDNVGGAALIGIPVDRTRIAAFVLSGTCAALAGLLFTCRIGFVAMTAGSGYEMTAIAACVIGGISLSGGVGSVAGAAIGAVFMSSISRILVFLKFPSDWDKTITGALLLIIVVADALLQRRGKEKARKQRLLAKAVKEEGVTAQ